MTTCRTVLIEDVPASDDAFGPEGPHNRVARAIAELIRSESGGKVVGLEGSWGSGKSTVVNLVRRHFANDQQVAVQVFDAWAHEGDPLRRSYLERLIRDLQDRGWVAKARWDEILQRISLKKRDAQSKTRTRPTLLGQAFALSALLVPFGTAHVTNALREGVTFGWGLPPSKQFIFGAALSLAPILVAIANLLQALVRRRAVEWSLLQQNETESFTTTTEFPNPTSIEFEKYFGDLMREALGESEKDRRLVLVVDNLDRVDADSALSIWSTLQTFLQDRRLRSESWFNRLWVIVPFDPTGLRKLWEAGAAPENTGGDKISAGDATAESFFDKSFQIRFYIAPPVLSDWREFLDGLLAKALPDHKEQDRHSVYRVYEHCTRQRLTPPTPRELIVFVNQIGAIHRQWLDEFPVEHVAYFVLERRKNVRLIESLRKGTVPRPDDAHLFADGGLTDSLAGLAFNVRSSKGRELLLSEPIRQALLGDGDLKELAESHPDGFWPVLELVVPTLVDADPATVGRAAMKLHYSALLDPRRRETRTVLEFLRNAAARMTSFEKWDYEMAEGVAALCRLLRDDSAGKLLRACADAMEAEAKPSPEPATLVRSLDIVLDVAEELGQEGILPDVIRLRLDPMGWRQACMVLAENDRNAYWRRIAPTASADEVVTEIQGRVAAGTFSSEDVVEIRVSSESALGASWQKLIPSIEQRIDSGQNAPPEEVHNLLAALWTIRRIASSAAEEALSRLVTQGHVANHLHRCRKARHEAGKAMCVFTSLYFTPEGAAPAAVGASAAGHQALIQLLASPTEGLITHIVELMRRFEVFDWPLRVLDARRPADPLISQCLRHVAEGDEVARTYTNAELVRRWLLIAEALKEGESESVFVDLVRKLDKEQGLSEAICNGAFSTTDARLYALIAELSAQGSPFLAWCRQGLEALPKAEWRSDLSGTASCCQLALVLRARNAGPRLSTEFYDALSEHARELTQGGAATRDGIDWPELLNCLPEGIRTAFRDRLLSLAVSRDGRIAGLFFDIYGGELASAKDWRRPHTVTHLFSPLVRERSVAGLAWLRNALEQDPAAVTLAAEQEEFRERLQRQLEEAQERQSEADVHIGAIATMLGLTPKMDAASTMEEERTEDATE